MKCPKCNKELKVRVATKLQSEACKVLMPFTSVFTIQCETCNHIFQVPIQSKSFLNIKKDENYT